MRRVQDLLLATFLSAGTAFGQAQAPDAGKATPPPAAAPAAAAPAAGTVPNTIEQRVTACAICHGKQGEGARKNEYYPRLAGKPTEYLYNQLIAFREKRRSSSPVMTYMVGGLSDNYLHEIAAYFSALRPPFPPPPAKPVPAKLAQGEALALNGDAAREIPACTACHGGTLTGMLPGIPGLVGLYPDYIAAQMGAWKNGLRNSSAPDCMARVASRLNGDDISAVAAYLASRTASPDAPPAPAQSVKLPLQCSSAK